MGTRVSVVTVFCATFSQIRISCLWLEICYPFSCGPVRHTQKTRNKNLQWTEESETCSDTLQPPSPVVANVEVCYKRTDGSQTATVVFGRHLQTKKQTFTVFGDWWHGTKALSRSHCPAHRTVSPPLEDPKVTPRTLESSEEQLLARFIDIASITIDGYLAYRAATDVCVLASLSPQEKGRLLT